MLQDEVKLRTRFLAPCLDPGEVYPVALDLLLELLSQRRGIALFRRASPLGQALAFRGFSEQEAERMHRSLIEQKPIDPARYHGVEVVASEAAVVARVVTLCEQWVQKVPLHLRQV